MKLLGGGLNMLGTRVVNGPPRSLAHFVDDNLNSQQSSWRNWSIVEWNEALFRHFFLYTDNQDTVSRIVLNDYVLQQVTCDDAASTEDVSQSFRKAVTQNLKGRNLVRVAVWSSRGNVGAKGVPSEFVYLAVSCYVATHAVDSGEEGNFRRRLNQFLDEGNESNSYDLADLPVVWQRFRDRLKKAIAEGRRFRQLLLKPQPQSRCIIGYSLDLAFPSHKDHRSLVNALAGHNLSESPPILHVLKILESRLREFGETFRAAYFEFASGVRERSLNLHQSPFWSSVRDAIVESCHRQELIVGLKPHAILRLDREEDWHFGLTIFLDAPPVAPLIASHAPDFAIDRFAWALSSIEGCELSPACWALNNRENGGLFNTVPGLQRTIANGVLFFEPNDNEVWLLRLGPPIGSRVRALIRQDVDEIIGTVLQSAGVSRRQSLYEHWIEYDRLSGSMIVGCQLSLLLPEVDVVQPTVEEPSLRVRGGVRTATGWLGLKPCLPFIATQSHSATVSVTLPHETEEVDCTELKEEGTFAFPSGPRNFDGDCIIRARRNGEVVRRTQIRFESRVLSSDYLTLTDPGGWLCESGTRDIGPLSSQGRTPDEIGSSLCSEPQVFRIHAEIQEGSGIESIGVLTLTEILAACSLRRRILSASETVNWFTETLELEPKYVWNVIRAWVEAGTIDQVISSSWRCTAFRARRPRFVLYRVGGSLPIRGVLQGLAPSITKAEIRRIADDLDIIIETRTGVSGFLPIPLIAYASKVDSFLQLSSLVGIDPPEVLRPLDACVVNLDKAVQYEGSLRANHLLYGSWRWDAHCFGDTHDHRDSGVHWFRRKDAPDSFVVALNDSALIHTLSKTWALLFGAKLFEKKAYSAPKESNRIVMSPGMYLPLPIGRWATMATGICPGPSQRGDYEYTFPSLNMRDIAIQTLWKTTISEDLRRRVHHINRICAAERYRHNQVPVPVWINEILASHEVDIRCERLTRSKQISRRLLSQLVSVASAIRSSSDLMR